MLRTATRFEEVMRLGKPLVTVALMASAAVASAQQVQGIPRTRVLSDTSGGRGAPNVAFAFPGAPADGVDTMRATIIPLVVARPEQQFIFWAYNGTFAGDRTAWYTGLQPHPRNGHKLLFSVFGPGSMSDHPNCKQGADGGPGTRCHLNFPWQVGHSYSFEVALIAETLDVRTWRGMLRDDASGARTIIGEISVPRTRGLLAPRGIAFTEFYRRAIPCAERPVSEALVLNVIAERGRRRYDGAIARINANGGPGGCNPKFYSDKRSYVYLRQGSRL